MDLTIDITPYITGNGTYDLALTTPEEAPRSALRRAKLNSERPTINDRNFAIR